MRVLVCGGRHYGMTAAAQKRFSKAWAEASRADCAAARVLRAALDELRGRITCLIHGGATGADKLAQNWAREKRVAELAFKADWYPNGAAGGLDRSQGPKRNQRMIDEGKPDLVLAFPGGRGTADMVKRARAAGIEVREVSSALHATGDQPSLLDDAGARHG